MGVSQAVGVAVRQGMEVVLAVTVAVAKGLGLVVVEPLDLGISDN